MPILESNGRCKQVLVGNFTHLAKFSAGLGCRSLLPRMTFDALKHRYVAEIYRMFEWFIGSVAGFAFAIGQSTEVDRMLNGESLED